MTACFILFSGFFSAQVIDRIGGGLSNNVSSYPVKGYPKIFYSAFHPGIDLLLEKKINKKEIHQFWLAINAGCFYHRLIQTAVKLNSDIKYRCQMKKRYFTEMGIGGGYLHSFVQYGIYRLNSSGEYEKIYYYRGRPQYMLSFFFGGGMELNKKDPGKSQLHFQFRTFGHGPFAKAYAPVSFPKNRTV